MKKITYYILPVLFVCLSLYIRYVAAEQEQDKTLQQDISNEQEDCLTIEDTRYGFKKKNGIYLLGSEDDIYKLAELVNRGKDIEEGVPAAEASYRLHNDITIQPERSTDFVGIGTKERPFCGVIDGDGHLLNGYFFADHEDATKYVMAYGEGIIVNLEVSNLFKKQFTSYDEQFDNTELFHKLLEASFKVGMNSSYFDLYVIVTNQVECDSLVDFLNNYDTRGALHIRIEGKFLDTYELANSLYERKGYDIDVEIVCNEAEQQAGTEMTAEGFLALLNNKEVSEEAASIMRDKQLWYFHRQMVDGLDCSSFLFNGWENGFSEYEADSSPALVLAEGTWQKEKNIYQLLTIPAPEWVSYSDGRFVIEAVDINFDGDKDLMINVGTSGGSGGSWGNYRSAVWDSKIEKFSYFPSMPEQISFFERAGRRIINRSKCGAGDETITAFEVVNGEYTETKSLNLVTWEEPAVLYYYEYDKLVEKIELDDLDQVSDLFPDMDYWTEG